MRNIQAGGGARSGTLTRDYTGPDGARSERATIPDDEIRILAMRVADAREWVTRDKIGLGYAVLLRGLIHAEQRLIDGEPWGGALVACWREVIEDFCARYDPQSDED